MLFRIPFRGRSATTLFVGMLAMTLVASAALALPHSRTQRAAFVRTHPCPATGKTKGACKGWVVDHRIALCVGGPDRPENMQWMTVADAKAKDKWECKPGWKRRLETPK